MGWGRVALAWIALLLAARLCIAQTEPPSEKLLVTAKSAATWSQDGVDIIQLHGPVTITLDRATLRADDAVMWLEPVPDGAPGQQRAQIALLGHAVLEQKVGTRSGDQFLVTAQVSADARITAAQRVARNDSSSALYRRAKVLRRQATTRFSVPDTAPTTVPSTTRPGGPGPRAVRPASTPKAQTPVIFTAGKFEITDTEEGTIAVVLSNGVKLLQRQVNGDLLELESQRAVLFTTLQSLKDAQKTDQMHRLQDAIVAAYLEGDVRIQLTPIKGTMGEQRLMADHVYYEFATDRAILLNAVLHTIVPKEPVPFILRAKVLRQLSHEEFEAKNVELTTSSFAVPSYSIAADRMYVRATETGDRRYPEHIEWEANNLTLQAFDIPFFYFPFLSGTAGDRPGALRGFGVTRTSGFGYEGLTQWGLFETLGQPPPRDIDASYRVDYFSDRGPAFGLNADYGGGHLTEPSKLPLNFVGDLKSYFVYDKGTDDHFGRLPVKPDGPGYVPRGRVLFEHQHFFPDDWQAQVRLGYVSDPTFMEQWFPRDFMDTGPQDVSAYIKRQRDNEAFTLLVEAQPNRLITTADYMQEQFEVEHLPEITYHRVGDSVADDHLTFFSDNSGAGEHYQFTRATLREQGFQAPTLLPGIPYLGTTGTTNDITWRGDFRQELDWPIAAGNFKIVPYVFGRYTEYSNSPTGSEQSRLFAGAGARFNTAFWKIDPTARSDIFDIHQMRHVIQPELNLFTSATNVDRQKVFIYDESIDSINDVSMAEIGLRQAWQTKRGGPGRWRSVDFLTLDVEADFYANKPRRSVLNPYDFRGLFFPSLPETSIPRDVLSANASWRLSDTTVILADGQYNLDAHKLATAAVGVLVRRGERVSYYIGNRYIADLNSNITSVQGDYQISPKYNLTFGQDFDFGLGKNVSSGISLVRHFDRFIMIASFSYDETTRTTSFGFNVVPEGFGVGVNSSQLQGPFRK